MNVVFDFSIIFMLHSNSILMWKWLVHKVDPTPFGNDAVFTPPACILKSQVNFFLHLNWVKNRSFDNKLTRKRWRHENLCFLISNYWNDLYFVDQIRVNLQQSIDKALASLRRICVWYVGYETTAAVDTIQTLAFCNLVCSQLEFFLE